MLCTTSFYLTFKPKYKTFIIYIVALSVDSGDEIHLSKKAQIAHLKADKASIKIFSKYANYAEIFLLKLAIKFSKHIKINNHTIELLNN